jgi:hypothetical protein
MLTQLMLDITRYSHVEICHILEYDQKKNSWTNHHEINIDCSKNETMKNAATAKKPILIHDKTQDRVINCKYLSDNFGKRIHNAMIIPLKSKDKEEFETKYSD